MGYIVMKKIVYEDNTITILLAKSGINSCTSSTRHINIRYFKVKDQLYNSNLTIEYFQTDEILLEFFTKTLQVTLFEIIRQDIMGWYHISLLKTEYMSEFKERVGNYKNEICSPETDSSPNWTQTYA